MKKRMLILVGTFCVAALMLLSCFRQPVAAAERKVPPYILDTKQKCKLVISTDIKQGTAGEVLEIYQVGLVDATGLSLSFVLTEEFEQSEVNLVAQGNTNRSNTVNSLYDYVEKQKISPFARVRLDESGKAELEVPQGAYLICHNSQQSSGAYVKIQPTLVGIPYVNASGDAWVYELDMILKAVQTNVATGDLQDPVYYGALAAAMMLLLGLLMLARKRR